MSWFNSSSSSSAYHAHEVRSVHSYAPFYDDDEGSYFGGGEGHGSYAPVYLGEGDGSYPPYHGEADVKPPLLQHWPSGSGHAHGGYGMGEDVKPVKVKQPRAGGEGREGRCVHDEETVLSWPVAEQFMSTLRTQESLAGLRAKNCIPEGFGLHPAGAAQAACAAPPRPARGGHGGGVPVCVYAQAFAAGMRLPLHPFLSDALTHFGIAPSQLAPNGWRVLAGFAVLCHFRGAGAPSLPVFRHFFALAPLPKGKGWFSFRARESVPALFTGLPTASKTWKEEFLLVSPPPGAPWRCPVRWGVPTKEATSDPLLTEKEAALARKLAQGQGVVDLKTYLSESNLVAAKISRAPACVGPGPGPGTDAPRGYGATAAVATGKKRKAPDGGKGGEALRSELQAKEKALAMAKGEISRLNKELRNAKTRELAEAREALKYERKLGTQVLKSEGGGGGGGGKGVGTGKLQRGAK